jgi:SAM-dependent methyltransferase
VNQNNWRLANWEERADLYDLFVEDRTRDIAFYSAFADETGGPVLEVGCGSGRILLPIAARGHQSVGVDFSNKMLDRFRQRLFREADAISSRVNLVCQDIAATPLEENAFSLVFFAFGMLGFLIEEGEADRAVGNAARSLKPGGTLIVERRNRFADRYHTAREFDWIKKWPEKSAIVCQSHTDLIVDSVRQIRQTLYFYEGIDSAGEHFAFQQVLYFREFSSLEIEELLRSAGLQVTHYFGDYDRRPFSPDQPRIIVVAKKAD